MGRCRTLLRTLLRKLLGSDFPDGLDPDLSTEFRHSQLEWRSKNLRFIAVIGLLMFVYFTIASGFKTPLHTFSRINNFITVVLFFFIYAVRAGMRDGFLPLNAWTHVLDTVLIYLSLGHYTFYILLTWPRTQQIVKAMGIESACVPDTLGEAYCVLFAVMAISIGASFHVLDNTCLFVFALATPCMWMLQCATLGTELESHNRFKLAGIFASMCAMTFIAGRRNNLEHMNSFLHLHSEREQVMRIFKQANVPIFIVGHEPGSSDLTVDLWNNALEELTQASVQIGTSLSHVPCIQSHVCTVLTNAVERALGADAQRTQRKLVPIVARSGVVWLKVDTSPILLAQKKKAIVIGSDVTEYVTRHKSLLHFVPEEGLGEQPRLSQKVGCCAELHPLSLTVLDCSPQLNILMQRQMVGVSFPSYIREDGRTRFQKAVASVLAGGPSQSIVLELCTEIDVDHRLLSRSRRSRRGPRIAVRKVIAEVSVNSEGSAEQGAVLINIHSYSSESTTSSKSDPGAEGLHAEAMDTMHPRARTMSDSSESASAGDVEEPAAANAQHPPMQVPKRRDGTDAAKMEAVMVHLVDFARHLNFETLSECIKFLRIAVEQLHDQCEESSQRFDKPCSDWRCQLCNALNDEEDDLCEVCRLGVPAPHKTDDIEDEVRRSEPSVPVAPLRRRDTVAL